MLPVLRANECQQRHQSMLPKPLSPLEIIIEATGCSEATARRDLDVLEKSGQLIRTIGGAGGCGRRSSGCDRRRDAGEEL